MLKACGECGNIRESVHDHDDCERCTRRGHSYRMLKVEVVAGSIVQNERAGFRSYAIKRALIRDALLSALQGVSTPSHPPDGLGLSGMSPTSVDRGHNRAGGRGSKPQRQGEDNATIDTETIHHVGQEAWMVTPD